MVGFLKVMEINMGENFKVFLFNSFYIICKWYEFSVFLLYLNNFFCFLVIINKNYNCYICEIMNGISSKLYG